MAPARETGGAPVGAHDFGESPAARVGVERGAAQARQLDDGALTAAAQVIGHARGGLGRTHDQRAARAVRARVGGAGRITAGLVGGPLERARGGLDVDREAHGRAGPAVARQQIVVSAAREHGVGGARNEGLKTHPRVIIEATHFSLVEVQGRLAVGRVQRRDDGAEVGERAFDAGRGRALGGRRQHRGRARELRQQAREAHGGGRAARLAQHLVEPARVALRDPPPRLGHGGLGQLERREHLAREAQVPEIDRGWRQAGRAQRRDAERDHLDVARRRAYARELDARLDELALSPPRALEPDDRALVRQPHGTRLVAEARRDEAGDLGRDVGPQRDDLTRARLDEADGRRPPRPAQAERQRLLILEGRRDDTREAPPLEHLEQRLGDPPARRRRPRRKIAHPRGQAQCGAGAHVTWL